MSIFTPASQVLQRHHSLFIDKHLLIAGDIHDDYPLQVEAKTVNVHCTQFHVYTSLQSRNGDAQIEFGLLPSEQLYHNVDVLVYFWPKNKSEAQFQLSFLLNSLAKGTEVFVVGENRSGAKSAESLLNNFGKIQKIDSARRCSLYYFQAESRLAFELAEWWSQYQIQVGSIDLTISNLPGVFSQKTLDIGSDLLLSALSDNARMIKGRVLDLGCGCGVLSAFLGRANREVELVSSDVSSMALSSTARTLQINHIESSIIASDVFSHIEGKFDLIVSNPPFHDGRETSYHAADCLIAQAKNYLTPQGKLCIVANTFLPYQQQLSQHFKHIEVLAQTTKFRVYLVG